MKAERRHELKTNALDRGIHELPELWRQYGSKVILVAIFVALVIVLIWQRANSARFAKQEVRDDLASAQAAIRDLRDPSLFAANVRDPAEITRNMLDHAEKIAAVLSRVQQNAEEPVMQAQALVALGDREWALANLPDLSAASTQPATAPTAQTAEGQRAKRTQALEQAQAYYHQAIERYPAQTEAVAQARFGLAAIAENNRDWQAAEKQYELVLQDAQAAPSFKSLATRRKDELVQARQPVWIATPTTMPAIPAAAPAEPTTAPATAPSATAQ